MISIRSLFENFRMPWSSQNRFIINKKRLPGTPTRPFGKSINRIKKMSNKLGTLTKLR